MRVALVCSFAAFLFSPADAGSFTCDSEYGALCPEESPGEGLVACLRKAGDDGKELSEDCKGWLSMWEACGDEIGKFCAGNEADAFLCLTQWTKRGDLGQDCASALPAPPQEEKKKPRKKSRAKAKRRAHEKAMKLAAEQEEEKKRADERKKRKKTKKTKKKAKRKKAKKQKKKGKKARRRGGDDEDFDEL